MIVEGGYIRVVQDVRGKYGSEGDYVMNRPLRGPQNPTPVDHATDTYDTIDWLVKNVPESNGKVGILGISYDGFLPLMALVNPHPALKVSVPMNPMVDGWMGDDWFHNGAFRQTDDDLHLRPGSDPRQRRQVVDEPLRRVRHVHGRPVRRASSDAGAGSNRSASGARSSSIRATTPSGATRRWTRFWRRSRSQVPVMLVHSLWDQEDIYGAIAVYKAIEPKDTGNDKVFLVMGPWHHGQEIGDGSTLGALRFGSDTGLQFRTRSAAAVPRPVPEGRRPKADIAPVIGVRDRHQQVAAAPPLAFRLRRGLRRSEPTPLYLGAGLKLGFDAPRAGGAAFEEYVSDPAKPVPYRARPVINSYDAANSWARWLVDDQREAVGTARRAGVPGRQC